LAGVLLASQRNEVLPSTKRKKQNMKTTKVLLLGAAVAAFSFASFAGTGANALKPSNETAKIVPADTQVVVLTRVDSATPISPRAQANQSTAIKGTSDNQNSTLVCRKNMVASPKAVAECSSHATMPGCTPATAMK
jgi:hypothetical protein